VATQSVVEPAHGPNALDRLERGERAEAALRGAPAEAGAFRAAADAELEAAEPLRDNAFKVPLARDVLVTVLAEVCA
jgi:xanthine dehydrogenase YagS FAD-binding subunit